MIINLFSIFDPSCNYSRLNWITLIIPLILISKNYFKINTRNLYIFEKIVFLVNFDIKNNIKNSYKKRILSLIRLFILILLINITSLLPFVFTPSRHISLTLSLALPFWRCILIKRWLTNRRNRLAHILPSNTPLLLCPFIVIIETIRTLIRPLALAVRLCANIIAGHILIFLLRKLLNLRYVSFMLNLFPINILTFLEISVRFIQAYVFIALLSLYLSESK